ncbi:Retrovirus-related Pol polyprotein from transposon opus [Merluccius polli]|uniref:Retrovirus-related Pol polyprotein from transposon opus n=1 Tax=Merluccius polli TaxID=89951 RepID=A0AA47MIQ6_MERPO|nr:Retrovirus-related Pol polyprotein from transposon opus [Merluccius polli]
MELEFHISPRRPSVRGGSNGQVRIAIFASFRTQSVLCSDHARFLKHPKPCLKRTLTSGLEPRIIPIASDVHGNYCKKPSHIVADCLALKKRNAKGTGLITTKRDSLPAPSVGKKVNECDQSEGYEPFVRLGYVSLPGSNKQPVRILCDTGASQSMMLEGILPLSDKNALGSNVLVRGIGMTFIPVPLHKIHLESDLVCDCVVVSAAISFWGMILGVVISGESQLNYPRSWLCHCLLTRKCKCSRRFPDVFPSCAITRAMSKRTDAQGTDNFEDLQDNFLANLHSGPTKQCDSNATKSLSPAMGNGKKHLQGVRTKMKKWYDVKAKNRVFEPGDKVLVLLLVLRLSLQSRFSGPYTVQRKVSDRDYVVQTPDRRQSSRLCHTNMLKPFETKYLAGESDTAALSEGLTPETPLTKAVILSSLMGTEEDDITDPSRSVPVGRLTNSEMLAKLPEFLSYLAPGESRDIQRLIREFGNLFGDVPSQTNVFEHDIDVGSSLSIKQHPYRVNPMKQAHLQHDCVDRVGVAVYVSKFDMLKGYYASFQRLVNIVLSGMSECEAFLDDIVLYIDRFISLLMRAMWNGPDGVEHPVCYFSRKFNTHQRAYSTIEKEALSLVLAIQHFEVYHGLSSHPITVYSDHNPLQFLNTNSNQRLMCWSLILQPYGLEKMHVRGSDNILADALSRGH